MEHDGLGRFLDYRIGNGKFRFPNTTGTWHGVPYVIVWAAAAGPEQTVCLMMMMILYSERWVTLSLPFYVLVFLITQLGRLLKYHWFSVFLFTLFYLLKSLHPSECEPMLAIILQPCYYYLFSAVTSICFQLYWFITCWTHVISVQYRCTNTDGEFTTGARFSCSSCSDPPRGGATIKEVFSRLKSFLIWYQFFIQTKGDHVKNIRSIDSL